MGHPERPRVYCAHPITSYGTEHEAACLAALANLLPSAELINPFGRYRTNRGWRRSWPRRLTTLSSVVVFGEEDGSIGVGCLREVTDAILWRLRVVGFAF